MSEPVAWWDCESMAEAEKRFPDQVSNLVRLADAMPDAVRQEDVDKVMSQIPESFADLIREA